jgi:hypothetical protein
MFLGIVGQRGERRVVERRGEVRSGQVRANMQN